MLVDIPQVSKIKNQLEQYIFFIPWLNSYFCEEKQAYLMQQHSVFNLPLFTVNFLEVGFFRLERLSEIVFLRKRCTPKGGSVKDITYEPYPT